MHNVVCDSYFHKEMVRSFPTRLVRLGKSETLSGAAIISTTLFSPFPFFSPAPVQHGLLKHSIHIDEFHKVSLTAALIDAMSYAAMSTADVVPSPRRYVPRAILPDDVVEWDAWGRKQRDESSRPGLRKYSHKNERGHSVEQSDDCGLSPEGVSPEQYRSTSRAAEAGNESSQSIKLNATRSLFGAVFQRSRHVIEDVSCLSSHSVVDVPPTGCSTEPVDTILRKQIPPKQMTPSEINSSAFDGSSMPLEDHGAAQQRVEELLLVAGRQEGDVINSSGKAAADFIHDSNIVADQPCVSRVKVTDLASPRAVEKAVVDSNVEVLRMRMLLLYIAWDVTQAELKKRKEQSPPASTTRSVSSGSTRSSVSKPAFRVSRASDKLAQKTATRSASTATIRSGRQLYRELDVVPKPQEQPRGAAMVTKAGLCRAKAPPTITAVIKSSLRVCVAQASLSQAIARGFLRRLRKHARQQAELCHYYAGEGCRRANLRHYIRRWRSLCADKRVQCTLVQSTIFSGWLRWSGRRRMLRQQMNQYRVGLRRRAAAREEVCHSVKRRVFSRWRCQFLINLDADRMRSGVAKLFRGSEGRQGGVIHRRPTSQSSAPAPEIEAQCRRLLYLYRQATFPSHKWFAPMAIARPMSVTSRDTSLSVDAVVDQWSRRRRQLMVFVKWKERGVLVRLNRVALQLHSNHLRRRVLQAWKTAVLCPSTAAAAATPVTHAVPTRDVATLCRPQPTTLTTTIATDSSISVLRTIRREKLAITHHRDLLLDTAWERWRYQYSAAVAWRHYLRVRYRRVLDAFKTNLMTSRRDKRSKRKVFTYLLRTYADGRQTLANEFLSKFDRLEGHFVAWRGFVRVRRYLEGKRKANLFALWRRRTVHALCQRLYAPALLRRMLRRWFGVRQHRIQQLLLWTVADNYRCHNVMQRHFRRWKVLVWLAKFGVYDGFPVVHRVQFDQSRGCAPKSTKRGSCLRIKRTNSLMGESFPGSHSAASRSLIPLPTQSTALFENAIQSRTPPFASVGGKKEEVEKGQLKRRAKVAWK